MATACPLTDDYFIASVATAGASVDDQGGADGLAEPGGSAGAAGTAVGEEGGRPASDSGGASGASPAATGGFPTGGARATGGAIAVECGADCSGTCCDDECVDLDTDAAHCGGCDEACAPGRQCKAGVCYGWTPMAAVPDGFVAREKAAYVAYESNLFVFGGVDEQGNALGDGAVYDGATDSWALLPSGVDAPSPRQLATAVWTDLRVFVFFGTDSSSASVYADGVRYDPSTDSWLPLPSGTTARLAPWAAAGSYEIVVWGGQGANQAALGGGETYQYNMYSTSVWQPLLGGFVAPEARLHATWIPGNDEVILFGGLTNGVTQTNTAYRFSFMTNGWTSLTGGGPSARWGAFGVWDGQAYYVWGGRDSSSTRDDGYRHTGSWSALDTSGAPSGRWAPHRRAGWAFALGSGDIVILGGMDDADSVLTDGGRYSHGDASWTEVASWPSGEAHEYGAAGELDGEIAIWGGRDGDRLTTTGERWLPESSP